MEQDNPNTLILDEDGTGNTILNMQGKKFLNTPKKHKPLLGKSDEIC